MTAALAKSEDPSGVMADTPKAVLRAKILVQEPGTPVQLILPAKDAADLVFIAEDFSKSVEPDDVETDRLVDAAAAISAKLRDCLQARGGS